MSVPDISELSVLFQQEQSTLEHLQAVLEDESKALLDRNILAIEGTAQVKVSALKAYQEQVNARLSFLLEHNYDGSESGLLSLMTHFPAPEQTVLKKQWQLLKQGFEDVIAQNERNGIVIFHSQQRNRNLLNILHGSQNEPNLYNGSGAAKGHSQRQRLGEA